MPTKKKGKVQQISIFKTVSFQLSPYGVIVVQRYAEKNKLEYSDVICGFLESDEQTCSMSLAMFMQIFGSAMCDGRKVLVDDKLIFKDK